MKYDYLIVGAGLYGCAVAHELHKAGKSVFVIDKRDHIGGNCASEKIDGIECHKYGPHVFHTDDVSLVQWLAQFGSFKAFMPQNKILYNDKLYNIPINLKTIEDVLNDGKKLTPEKARRLVLESCEKSEIPNTIEGWCVENIGSRLYLMCVHAYTIKQWGMSPKDLPSDIIKRLPIRYNYNANYFNDKYSVVPEKGWTYVFKQMINGIPYLLNQDYFKNKEGFDNLAKNIIYTGPIDKYFNYEHGELSWRSLKFYIEGYAEKDYQGQAVIHNGNLEQSWTRAVEYKHIHESDVNYTVVIREESCFDKENPYYPINTESDKGLFKKYEELAAGKKDVYFKGRLGTYKYNDMDTTLKNVFEDVKNVYIK